MSMCRTAKGVPKLRFATRAEAKDFLKRVQKLTGEEFDEGAKPYRCRRCDWFHIGHYPTGEAREHLRAHHREDDVSRGGSAAADEHDDGDHGETNDDAPKRVHGGDVPT